SITAGGNTCTDTRSAHATTAPNSSARVSGSSCFESFRSASGRALWSRTASRSSRTAATTRGPASGPRPASSAPTTNLTPRRRSNARSFRPVSFATRPRIAPAPAAGIVWPRLVAKSLLTQLADAGLLADLAAEVVQLCAVHVSDRRDVDLVDLRR